LFSLSKLRATASTTSKICKTAFFAGIAWKGRKMVSVAGVPQRSRGCSFVASASSSGGASAAFFVSTPTPRQL
jgi:hypothetical protein